MRALGIRYLSVALEDELSELADSASVSRNSPVFQYLGWDGHGRRTLKMAATAGGVTKDRVRLLVMRTRRRLSLARSWTPILVKASDLCQQLCPRPAAEIADVLQQSALARVKFHPYGLVTAAQAVGLAHSFAIKHMRGGEWLVTTTKTRLPRRDRSIK